MICFLLVYKGHRERLCISKKVLRFWFHEYKWQEINIVIIVTALIEKYEVLKLYNNKELHQLNVNEIFQK